jgi:hypothetical protein
MSVKSVISPTLPTDSLYRHRPTTDLSVRFRSVKAVWAGPKLGRNRVLAGPKSCFSWAETGPKSYIGLLAGPKFCIFWAY